MKRALSKREKKGIHALYKKDPTLADERIWGRQSNGRRGFLKVTGLIAMEAVLGTRMVHASNFPAGTIPASLANSTQPFSIPGKDPSLIVLNDRPLNAETPPHLLDPISTPSELFFIRNNGLPPERSEINIDSWTVTIDGESVTSPKSYTLRELKNRFQHVSLHLTIECGGNGRAEFNPPASGNQWTTGAVGCAKFTGIRLKDVLEDVGINEDAKYIGYYGADKHLSGDPSKDPISRGVPLAKALEAETMLAWDMNDNPLPYQNGYPLRLVVGGWPGSCSGKWITRISVRNKIHDGVKMGGSSYRIPCNPVAPGEKVSDDNMCIIESMPVKSLITYPQTGALVGVNQAFEIRGHAWAGDHAVRSVEYSTDFGITWKACDLKDPPNRLAWQQFKAGISLDKTGYYEIWARATDSEGRSQPMLLPGWNPKGYLNNACHRIAVKIV